MWLILSFPSLGMSYARCPYFTAGDTEAVRGWERYPQSQQRTELEVAELFTPPTTVIIVYFFSCFYFTLVAPQRRRQMTPGVLDYLFVYITGLKMVRFSA